MLTWAGCIWTTQDACIRLGMAFEPVINCHGLWYNGGFNDYPATPAVTRSALWLSVLTADLPLQLTFLLMESSWAVPGAVASHGWLQTVAVSTWAAEARMLAPSFFPEFGSAYAATSGRRGSYSVTLEKAAVLRTDVAPDGAPLAVRVWQEECGPATNSSGLCLHLIVVNTVEDSPVAFTARLAAPADQPRAAATEDEEARPFPMAASVLFDSGGYNVTVDADGRLTDWIGPAQTLVYEVGCNGARVLAPDRASYTELRPWASCSNRRVQCIDGFIKTAPNGARCAARVPSVLPKQEFK